jgi:GNAT superfamily N-acetyltransferase
VNPLDAITVACYQSFASLPGARLIENDEIRGVASGLPISFFSGIATTDLRDESGIDRAVAAFTPFGAPFRWWISPSVRPANLETLLQARGFRHVYDAGGMVASRDDVPISRSSPVPIRQVTALREWAEVLMKVFDRPAHEAEVWMRVYETPLPGWASFAAYEGSSVIATSSVLCAGDLAGIYHVATMPSARGRGVGAAITLEAMRFAFDRGAKHAVLQSSEMGASVYRSLGFRDVAQLRLYEWRPAPR